MPPFASASGYTPKPIADIIDALRVEVNAQFGTTYTSVSFVGTNFYKFLYAAAQRMQQNEIAASEIFSKLQDYIVSTNQSIARPVVTPPGIIDAFDSAGFRASVKQMIAADAGKCSICVLVTDDHARGKITITSYANLVSGTHDTVRVGATTFTAQATAVVHGGATFQAATSNAATATSLADQINNHATAGALFEATVNDTAVIVRYKTRGTGGNSQVFTYTDNDSNVGATISGSGTLAGGVSQNDDYDDLRLQLCTLIKNSVVAGVITQGDEVKSLVLTNGQSFDFRFSRPNIISVQLRLTITLSINNREVIKSDEDIKNDLLANIAAKYNLGQNFEPEKYYSTADAPWASVVLLEWSSDGGSTWLSTVYSASFNDLFDTPLANITLVEV